MKQLLSLLLILFSANANAQHLKLISATKQPWAGGVAGSQGNSYVFTIKIDNKHKSVKLSSLWMEEQQFDIANDRYTVTKEALKDGRTVQISVRTSSATKIPGHTRAPQPAPIAYKGVALIGYTINGKQQYFAIKKVTKQLPPLSYP